MMEPSDTLVRTKNLLDRDAREQTPRFYLLVVTQETSSIHHLPQAGTILIGRVPEAGIQLHGTAVSRKHASIAIEEGEVRITDLGSSNGTCVNGHRIQGVQPLVSGDAISIGDIMLVLNSAAGRRSAAGRPAASLEELRRRLKEEIERSRRYQRPLSLLALHFVAPPQDRAAVLAALASKLPQLHLSSWSTDAELLIMAPDLASEQGIALAAQLVASLPEGTPEIGAGLACCPADGCDADTLLTASRAAAEAARPSSVMAAQHTATRLQMADRTVLIADPAMMRIYELIRRIAVSDLQVLICGETGVGKENAAFAVHHHSRRSDGPFVAINCAAIPESLVESELFGHEKGAFSGAISSKLGLLESAHGGTVFLDEVGELPLAVQAKLLRALEARCISRVGALRDREIDIRVVAATNRDLEEEVTAGRFRKDLYFRLLAATVILPPLRERPREISLLARTFLADACQRLQRQPATLSAEALQVLSCYGWPGNVRELKNTMDYVAAATQESVVLPHHLPERISGQQPVATASATAPDRPGAAPEGPSTFRPLPEEIRELEVRRLTQALEAAGGVKARAANLIGMPIRTFADRLKHHGIEWSGGKR